MRPVAFPGLLKLLALGGGSLFALSRLKQPRQAPRVILVTGSAQVQCPPEFARLRVAVKTRDDDAKTASDTLRERVSVVLDALKTKADIAPEDLQTTNLSIRQEQQRPEPKAKPITRYLAYSQVGVLVRNLEDLGTVLDVASKSGVDEIEDLSFDIHDPKGPKRRALALAVRDAKDQAQVLARSVGMQLGPVLHMSDGTQDHEQPIMLSHASRGYSGAIATGSLTIGAQAHLKFELHPIA